MLTISDGLHSLMSGLYYSIRVSSSEAGYQDKAFVGKCFVSET